MPILMTDIYAGEQGAIETRVKRQLEEENRYKLAEMMRTRDAEAKARDILTRRANEAQTQVQPQVQGILPGETAGNPNEVLGALAQPQGMVPQEGLTGFGGMSTPQEGPVGLQPQGDATGLGGMQPTGWSEDQTAPVGWSETQTTSPLGHEAAIDNTIANVERTQAKVDQHTQIANELRKAGLHDQADAYDKKTIAAQKDADLAMLEHYKVGEKGIDFIGSQANGYLNAIKNPNVNPDAAWQRMKLAVQTAGISTEELDAVPRDQRQAYAEQIKDSAFSSKEQISLETALLKDKTKRDLQNQTEKLRRDILSQTTKDHAATRELGEKRLDWSKTKFETKQAWEEQKFEYTQLHEGIKTQLNQTKVSLDETDKSIKDIQTRKMELDKGNLYFDTNGHPISSSDEETRNAESKLLLEKLAMLNERKDSLLKDIDDLGTNQTELEKSLPKFAKEGAKADTTAEPKPTASKFVYTAKVDKDSRKNYETFMKNSKSITDPQERAQAQAKAQQMMLDSGFIKPR